MEIFQSWQKTTTKRRSVSYLEIISFMAKGIWNLPISYRVMSWSSLTGFVLPAILSGAKRENLIPLLLHSVERIIAGNYFIDGLKSRTIFSTIAPTSFPRYLFFPRLWERGCHCTRASVFRAFGSSKLSRILTGSLCRWHFLRLVQILFII